MAVTYEPIATTTLGSAASEVEFTSISGSFTDIILVISNGIQTGGGAFRIQLNGDTGTNYSSTNIEGDGSSATSARFSNLSYLRLGQFDDGISNVIVHFQNYSNTTTNKTVISRSNAPASKVSAWVGLWRDTDPITSMKVYISGQTWDSGGTFTLYGIAAA